MRRAQVTMVALAAVLVLLGGAIHLREWSETYRHVPAASPGAAVVRYGFPVHTALSALAAASLMLTALWRPALPWFRRTVLAAIVLEAASITALIVSRNGSLAGWSEVGWSRGAAQSLVVEAGAFLLLALLLGSTLTGASYLRRARV